MPKRDLTLVGDAPPPAPQCRGCGKTLQPVFFTEYREVERVTLSDLPGPGDCRPEDTRLIEKGYSPDNYDPASGKFRHKSVYQETVGKRWAGYFGYDHNSLFCTLRCGYAYGVRAAKRGTVGGEGS